MVSFIILLEATSRFLLIQINRPLCSTRVFPIIFRNFNVRNILYQIFAIFIIHTLAMRRLKENFIKYEKGKLKTEFYRLTRNMHWLIYHHHHHHVVPQAGISLTLSRHFSLSFIASGRSSGLHPVSSRSYCM